MSWGTEPRAVVLIRAVCSPLDPVILIRQSTFGNNGNGISLSRLLYSSKPFMTLDTFSSKPTQCSDRDLYTRASDLPEVRSLVLHGAAVTDEGAKLLGRCRKLKELHILGTSITDVGMRSIAKIYTLDWLVIDETPVTDEGLFELSGLAKLNGLQLTRTKMTEEGLQVLFHFPELSYLEVIHDNLGRTGLSLIAQLPVLSVLRVASRTAGIDDLLGLTFSRSLKSLTFDMPRVSKSDIERLKEAMPRLDISQYVQYQRTDGLLQLMSQCLDLHDEGQYDRALSAVNDVLSNSSKNPAIYGVRAIINFRLGKMMDFKGDLTNLRDNAKRPELKELAESLLEIKDSIKTKRILDEEKPERLLLQMILEHHIQSQSPTPKTAEYAQSLLPPKTDDENKEQQTKPTPATAETSQSTAQAKKKELKRSDRFLAYTMNPKEVERFRQGGEFLSKQPKYWQDLLDKTKEARKDEEEGGDVPWTW